MKFLFFCKHADMYRRVSEHSQEITIFFNRSGKITSCNSKALQELGYGTEIYQLSIHEIFRNSFQYEAGKLIVMNPNDNKSTETIAYRQNQTCFTVELTISIKERWKQNYGLCIAKNVTNSKEADRRIDQLQNEIASLNKNRNRITANITHELRTPVNGIMGLSNNLLETDLKPEQTEIVQLIKHCCNNMNILINDLLDYAKLTSEKMILEQREFSFRECINTILEFNRPRINDKGLQLLVYISDDIPNKVIGDELRLTQILNNLLSNAVKFTMIGQVALEIVKTSETSKYIELFFVVIDTGIGISHEEKDKLFQSFTQVDGSITRRFGGTGLGLAISKRLVEAMGGTIGVESEKDKGSTFSFSLRLGLPEEEIDKPREIHHQDDNIKVQTAEAQKELWSQEEVLKKLSPILERLALCIDMESWDKAEELAYYMKKQVPSEQGEITKIIFRLLLAVRKEQHDISVTIINELKTFIAER